ncbi:MAG: TIGR04086 family membrane protein [Lachnospiraceae bacterium]|nr:TIGR04086 family membrane protein [Lachnospiraceae bacterium]
MPKNTIPIFFLKMLFIAFVLTSGLLLALAFLLYRMKWNAGQATIGVYVVYFLSCFIPAFLTGKKLRSRRLLWGLAVGGLYFALLFLVSALVRTGLFAEPSRIALVLTICAGSGALGGIAS